MMIYIPLVIVAMVLLEFSTAYAVVFSLFAYWRLIKGEDLEPNQHELSFLNSMMALVLFDLIFSMKQR
ncbi:hypothetical protein [Thalassobacillus sp. CUG 92003]|uniref:hypothetical protein n=1 Tax=Thalassobacillus sp. CUG 92003 TaxID=2736641 RepID=UPI0015E7799D|nr:hypothetical protein [Thalassobacillus sp. CUG 92003]